MTDGLPRLKRRPQERRTTEAAIRAASVWANEPEISGETSTSTPQRKVADAPAKVGWTNGMVGIFKKIFFGKDPKMKAVEAGPCSVPCQTFDAPQAYPGGRWTVFKNPFVKRSNKPVAATPVQGELLLDLVKPIRNDLSDSDLELVPAAGGKSAPPITAVVPAKPVPSHPQPRMVAPACEMEPVTAAWGKVNEEYFGMENR